MVELERGPETASGMERYVFWINQLLDHETMVRDLFVECPLTAMAFRRQSLLEAGGYRDRGWPGLGDLPEHFRFES